MGLIPLTRGFFAQVDDADFAAVSALRWSVLIRKRRIYAKRNLPRNGRPSQSCQFLHQFLLPGAKLVDHKDGDGLNCQRHNLRAATCQQNLQGFKRKKEGCSSRYIGVSWHKKSRKWYSKIVVNYRKMHLGVFLTEARAALEYDAAARKYFGQFASLNFPA